MQIIGIVGSSQANRRSKVTKASFIIPRDSVRYPLNVCGESTTLRFVSERIGTPCGLRTGFVRYPLKICGDLWLPYDRLAFLYQNVDKRQIKKSNDAFMNCKHIRRSPRSPTMSKKSYGKSQTEKSYDDRGKCNLGLSYIYPDHSTIFRSAIFLTILDI